LARPLAVVPEADESAFAAFDTDRGNEGGIKITPETLCREDDDALGLIEDDDDDSRTEDDADDDDDDDDDDDGVGNAAAGTRVREDGG
jgi:hypothetical protein